MYVTEEPSVVESWNRRVKDAHEDEKHQMHDFLRAIPNQDAPVVRPGGYFS